MTTKSIDAISDSRVKFQTFDILLKDGLYRNSFGAGPFGTGTNMGMSMVMRVFWK